MGWSRNVEQTLQAFGVSFAKPFLLKIAYSEPSKMIEIWSCHFLCSCSYDKYNSKKLYCAVYVHGSYHLSV